MKFKSKVIGSLFLLLLLIFVLPKESVNAVNKYGELTVTFIHVGQGDCILLQSEGKAMLVDAGKREYGENVVEYLKEHGISKLDYAVISHDDADHIGGYSSVLESIHVGKIIRSRVRYNGETNCKIVNDAIKSSTMEIYTPVAGSEMTFGSATIQFLAPNTGGYTSYNDNSLVMRVVNGKNSFLLTGDAEATSEKEMIEKGYELKSDVLKVGHHSALTSSTQEFIDAVNPSISVITCDAAGLAGFPRRGTIDKLTKSDIFRTDISGDIVFVSDGTTITTDAEPYFYANSTYNQKNDKVTRTLEEECCVLKDVGVDSDYEDFLLHSVTDDDNYDLVITEPLELTFTADWGISKIESIQYSLVDSKEEPDIDSMEWLETDEGSVTLTDDFDGIIYVKFENQLGNIVIRKTTGFMLDCKAPTNCTVSSNIEKLKLVNTGAVNTYNRYTCDNWYPTFNFSCKYGKSGKGKIEYMLVERGRAFYASEPWTIGKTLTITDDFIGRIYVRFTDGAGNTIIKKTQGFKWIIGKPINHAITSNVEGIQLLTPSQKAKTCVAKENVKLNFSADFGHGGKKAIQYQIVKKAKKAKKYNPSGPWVTGESITLKKGFNGVVYIRFIDQAGYCNIRKTNTIRIKK
ncbi:MAG: MBL fold metallo-hydrolase [Clostridium sp.]|nr:MBL fold metallo-hydrolase [Clostridium sp.]